jgi:hypothetical protein
MPILGEQGSSPAPTPAHGKARIQAIYNEMCATIEQRLAMVRQIVEFHGRSNIDTEFGADATEFANFYATAKTFAESHPGCTVEDLPT